MVVARDHQPKPCFLMVTQPRAPEQSLRRHSPTHSQSSSRAHARRQREFRIRLRRLRTRNPRARRTLRANARARHPMSDSRGSKFRVRLRTGNSRARDAPCVRNSTFVCVVCELENRARDATCVRNPARDIPCATLVAANSAFVCVARGTRLACEDCGYFAVRRLRSDQGAAVGECLERGDEVAQDSLTLGPFAEV
jgi:hypothetical protein